MDNFLFIFPIAWLIFLLWKKPDKNISFGLPVLILNLLIIFLLLGHQRIAKEISIIFFFLMLVSLTHALYRYEKR